MAANERKHEMMNTLMMADRVAAMALFFEHPTFEHCRTAAGHLEFYTNNSADA